MSNCKLCGKESTHKFCNSCELIKVSCGCSCGEIIKLIRNYRITNYKHGHHRHTSSGYYYSSSLGKVRYKSRWELKRMIFLDNSYARWSTGYGIEVDYIKNDGSMGRYSPTFVVNCGNSIIVEDLLNLTDLRQDPDRYLAWRSLVSLCRDNGWKYRVITPEMVYSTSYKELIKFK